MASYFGMPPPNGGILGGGIVRRGPRTKPRRGGSVGGRGITSVPFQPVPGTPRPSGGPTGMPRPGILGGGKPSFFPGWGGSPTMAFPTDGGFGVGHGQPSQDWPNWRLDPGFSRPLPPDFDWTQVKKAERPPIASIPKTLLPPELERLARASGEEPAQIQPSQAWPNWLRDTQQRYELYEQPVFGPAQRQPATFDPNNRKDWAPGTTFADAIAGRAKTVDFPYGPRPRQPNQLGRQAYNVTTGESGGWVDGQWVPNAGQGVRQPPPQGVFGGNMQPMYPSTPYTPGPGWGGSGIMGGKLGGPTQGPSMAGPMGGGAGINPQMVMSLMRILGGGR